MTPPFEILGYGAEVGLNTTSATPPVNAYVGVDDQVAIWSATAVAGAILNIWARLLLPNGTIVLNNWTVSIATNRQGVSTVLTMPECFILSVAISCKDFTSPAPVYCRLTLTRNALPAPPVTFQMAAGYASSNVSISWPGGQMDRPTAGRGNVRSITGTTPAAGAEISETVPSNALWRFMSLTFLLTTSAAVATRVPMLGLDDGTNVFARLQSSNTLAAGGAAFWSWAEGITSGITGGSTNNFGIPIDMFLPGGFRFRTITNALQAGDQYSAVQYLVEEWIMS